MSSHRAGVSDLPGPCVAALTRGRYSPIKPHQPAGTLSRLYKYVCTCNVSKVAGSLLVPEAVTAGILSPLARFLFQA